MKATNSAPTFESPPTITFHAVDHGPWQEAQAALQAALTARGLDKLTSPVTLILHDLLENAVHALHLHVFRGIVEADFGMPFDEESSELEALYRSEIIEHGVQNLARACAAAGQALRLGFPVAQPGADVLFALELPCALHSIPCRTERLIAALGLHLQPLSGDGHDAGGDTAGCRIALIHPGDAVAANTARDVATSPGAALALSGLLEPAACADRVARIAEALDYGLIDFSAAGEIRAVSPSILARLGLAAGLDAILQLGEALPLAFHNDILWGLALAEGRGAFENYRIRVPRPDGAGSILFNVSGYREAAGTVHSLWQVVSQDEGGTPLAEGSILSEVRIHNITRNYVPQLVEQKAREAVRLGKTALGNEQRAVAVLFCDIVGFTSYVEGHADSESVIDTLNSLLRRVAVSVKRNRGAIDKFMGDCIMALFDDPADALLAAIDMQSHAEDINTLRQRAGQQTLQLRIGIHWGDVVIGNVGTAERLDWTAIGDVVNTASRIEKGCRPGAILVSRAVRDAVLTSAPEKFVFDATFGLQLRGKRDQFEVCHAGMATTAD